MLPRRPSRGTVGIIALGGAAGSAARYAVAVALPASTGRFPWGTFVVNMTGSLLIGLALVMLLERFRAARHARALIVTGFLGGYTTFSTYAVDTDNLWRHHDILTGAVYVVASLAAGLVATVAGLVLARSILRWSSGTRTGTGARGRTPQPPRASRA